MQLRSVVIMTFVALALVPASADVASAEPFGACGADTVQTGGVSLAPAFRVADTVCSHEGRYCVAYVTETCLAKL